MASIVDAVEIGEELYDTESFEDWSEDTQEDNEVSFPIDSLPAESENVPVLVTGEVEEAQEDTEQYDFTGEDDDEVTDEPLTADIAFANLTIAGEGDENATSSDSLSTDYTQLLTDIKSSICNLATSDNLAELSQKIDELDNDVLIMNQNIVTSSQNESLYLKFQLGFIVAIFGALIIYFLFSKIR